MSLRCSWQNYFLRLSQGMACALLMGLTPAVAYAEQVAFDNFEGLTLKPFDVMPTGVGDGTDYLRDVPRWTRDDSGMPYQVDALPADHSGEIAYEGWAAMDANSWLEQQGDQGHRQSGEGSLVVDGIRNTALIADPDAWDDFNGAANSGYNTYFSTTIDVSGVTSGSVSLELDYQFRTEVTQRGTVETSIDGGTTWQMVLDLDSTNFDNGTVLWGKDAAFSVAVPAGTSSLIVRLGCTLSGNNWSFAVDNVEVRDGTTDLFIEDFEGLTLLPFGTAAGQANPPLDPPGDGTDYTNEIPNWTIDNSLMGAVPVEGAFNGWTAIDAFSWVDEQGDQDRSLFFGNNLIFGDNNTILCADGDAGYDYASFPDNNSFNTFISRKYDLSGHNNLSLKVTLDYEFRVEPNQHGRIEASFDGGLSWVILLDLDSVALADAGQNGARINTELGPQSFTAGTDFTASKSNSMILRIGNFDGGNNWWFAVDNILIEADPQNFVLGDANGDGVLTNADIPAFVLALTDPGGFAAAFPNVNVGQVLDFTGDGSFTNGDIPGFVNVLSGN